MTDTIHEWRWYNRNEMAVRRSEVFTYSVWRWADRDGWGASVDMKLEHQLVKDIGIADGATWEEAADLARKNAIEHLDSLKSQV